MKTKLLLIFAILVAADQIAKNNFANTFCNKNLAWSVSVPAGIFCFAWTAIVAALIYMLFKTEKYYQKIFLAMIFSGAISNLIDRLRFGCVVDYIDLKFWPVFNLGDVSITLGILLLVLSFAKIKNTKY